MEDKEVETPGNPYVSGALCDARRDALHTEMMSIKENIQYTVKIVGLVITLIVSLVQLTLFLVGGK